MKVLMLGWELPPYNSGGLGVACLNLCKKLTDKGADIEFILPYKAEHDLNFMNITGTSVQPTTSNLGVYNSSNFIDTYNTNQAAYMSTVEKVITNQQFDVIHAHDWLTFRAALKAKELTGWPLIAHVHATETDRSGGGIGNKVVREIEAHTLMIADTVIAVSEHTKQVIARDYSIPLDKISVVHNAIEPMDFKFLDLNNSFKYLKYTKARGYKIICNVGRQTLQKGLPNLLRAAKQVIACEPKVIFLLVGSGEQHQELIDLAAELGISANVIFTGFLRGKQLRDSFDIADLFVMPSVSEPFGLTPLEAAICKTPSLISKQSGVSEVLRNVLVVDYWDIDQMANKIVAIVQNDGLRDVLASNVQDEVMKLSWQKQTDTVLSIYENQLAGAVN